MELLVVKYRDYLEKERNYSKDTVVAYLGDVQSFREFVIGDGVALIDVCYDEVRAWIVCLSEAGLGNRSINRKMSALKSFYGFLQKIGQVEVNPLQLHRSLKENKKLQIPFSQQEMDMVRALFDGKDDFESLRDLLIIELLYSLGLRLSELTSLEVGDFDLYSKTVSVVGKGDKERRLPLLMELVVLLQGYLGVREGVLAGRKESGLLLLKNGNKVEESFVYRMINNYFSMVTSKEKKSPHVLRHTFATHLLNNGADINSIKELMGHSSLSSTEVYTHANLAELKKVYEVSHPRMKKK